MRRYVYALASVLVTFLLSGCFRLSEIRVGDVKVESVSMSGLRSIGGTVSVHVDNHAGQMSLDEIQGELIYFGKVIGMLALDPFIIDARTARRYDLNGKFTLSADITALDLMMMLRQKDIDEFKMNVSAKARTKGGISRTLKYDDIPAGDLMKFFR